MEGEAWVMSLWTKFLQWVCPHKHRIFKTIRYQNTIMIACEESCEDCNKIICVTRAFDWGYKIND